jgi:hypothetical protein
MIDPNGSAARIGDLLRNDAVLAKRIAALRQRAEQLARTFSRLARVLVDQPERLAFDAGVRDPQFAGETAIDRQTLDAASLDAMASELRSAIVEKKQLRCELANAGIDLEEIEDEENARRSRALHFQSGSPSDNHKKEIGFARPRRR